MRVEARIVIAGSRAAVWAALTDIEHAAGFTRGIERIEILERPAQGLAGLRWRETRILFGDEATVEKRITAAVDGEYYETSAADSGFVFITTLRLADTASGVAVTSTHETHPQGLAATLRALPMFLFKGVIRKAILQDLADLQSHVERERQAGHA